LHHDVSSATLFNQSLEATVATTPEAALTKKIIDALNAIPGCYAEKIHASQFGMPKLDVFGAYRGKMIYLEIKVPGKKPTPRQQATIRKWREKAGVHTGWTNSVAGALKFVEELESAA